ncbi:HD domain-containing protein [Jimgerdemannia flammicorona]|uniref:HD domain-containing protein n=1 Tax=Jimgerdemannia flammicorona TaxID=994334 RepID=A0A433P5E1_9FUNG|nr:HD domain-containing protein [Jimgerdemannia flammicorona]
MYRMVVMVMVAGDISLDVGKCVQLAIIHDLAESIVGDITPHDNVSVVDKHNLEQCAMLLLCNLVGCRYLIELYTEYEQGDSREARFVKDLDRFEMVLQAFQYETDESDNKISSSLNSSTRLVAHLHIQQLYTGQMRYTKNVNVAGRCNQTL